MKKYLFVLFIAIIIFLGCTVATTISPSDASGGGGGGGASNPNLAIVSTISYQHSDYMGMYVGRVMHTVQLFDTNTMSMVTGATVTVSGPGGVITLDEELMAYVKDIVSPTTPDVTPYYQFGANYTVSVTTADGTFTHTEAVLGDITIASDGSTVSWTREGNMDQVNINPPSAAPTVVVGPDTNSPVDINATGVYGNGPGTYLIAATIQQQTTGAFTGTSSGSTFVTVHQYGISVLK